MRLSNWLQMVACRLRGLPAILADDVRVTRPPRSRFEAGERLEARLLLAAPVAMDDAFATDEDHGVSGDLFADNGAGADSDADMDPFTVTEINGGAVTNGQQVTLGNGGVLTIHSDGTFDYDPSGNFEGLQAGAQGTETFTYTIDDGHGGTAQATATITINGVNDDPVATDNEATLSEDSTGAGNLLQDGGHGADSDPDGDTLTVTEINGTAIVDEQLVMLPSGAAVLIYTNGDYAYLTNGLYDHLNVGDTATDSFTYTISDGHGGVSTATVTITITGANDAPSAQNNSNSVGQNGTASGNLITDDNGTGVDSDPDDGATIHVGMINGVAVTDGQTVILPGGSRLLIHADGSYSYDPHGKFDSLGQGQTANETFSYTIMDEHGAMSTANVTITVTGVNDAPHAAHDDLTTDESDALSGNLITADNGHGADSDIDGGDTLSVTQINGTNVTNGQVITLPSGARLTIQSNGNYTYDPHGAFNSLSEGQTGSDSFTYTITDGHGETSTATVTVTINGYDPRADVKAVRQGTFVNLAGKKLTLGVDVDVVFTGNSVQLIGRHGTTINGQASVTFDGVTSLKGVLGSGDDNVHVTGEAKQFKLDLGGGENAVQFEDFVSLKQTTILDKRGDLSFEAVDSEFQKLLVQTGNGHDSLKFDGVTVGTTTALKLSGGSNELFVDGSSFGGNLTLQSTGAGTHLAIESGIGNATDSEFLGAVKINVGASAVIDLSDTIVSDTTVFQKQVSIVAKAPNAVLTVSNAGFAKQPVLKNITVIA